MTQKENCLKCASFFAGPGGMDIGFRNTGMFETVYANESNPYGAIILGMNLKISVDMRDIRSIASSYVPKADIYISALPTASISIEGLFRGFSNKSGEADVFVELLRLIKSNRPRAVLFEASTALMFLDNGNTVNVIMDELGNAGYYVSSKTIEAYNYGNIPQNRKSIFIIAFKNNEDLEKFEWPSAIPLTATIKDFVDFYSDVGEAFSYREGKHKGSIYEKLKSITQNDNPENPSVYQWRRDRAVRIKTGMFPRLSESQGNSGHSAFIVKTKSGIRKVTPYECFRIQGFPESFILPENISNRQLYHQSGCTTCVPVIERIAEKIAEVLK